MFSPSSDSFPSGNRPLLTNLLQPILTAAIQATDAARGNIQLLDADRAILRIVVHQGFDEPFLSYFSSVHEDRFGCGTAMKRRKRTVVEDVQESPLFSEEARQAMIAARALACQSTPLITSDGKMVGMMSTHFSATSANDVSAETSRHVSRTRCGVDRPHSARGGSERGYSQADRPAGRGLRKNADCAEQALNRPHAHTPVR